MLVAQDNVMCQPPCSEWNRRCAVANIQSVNERRPRPITHRLFVSVRQVSIEAAQITTIVAKWDNRRRPERV